MARTISEIKKELTDNYMRDAVVQTKYGFTADAVFQQQFSKISIENILFDLFAFASWTTEKLFDIHKEEVTNLLTEQKSGTLNWYKTKALLFQYGFDLQTDSDLFVNGTATQEQIDNSKIVKYAAVNETTSNSRIVLKIAGETNNILSPITNDQYDAFVAYINEVKFAGVTITTINYLPDRLLLDIVIYRDPLVIDAAGSSIINGGKPVEAAIKEYMKELPFNGELVLEQLVDKLQQVEGVKIPHLRSASSSWIDADTQGYTTIKPIYVKTVPVSGYFEVLDFSKITYVV